MQTLAQLLTSDQPHGVVDLKVPFSNNIALTVLKGLTASLHQQVQTLKFVAGDVDDKVWMDGNHPSAMDWDPDTAFNVKQAQFTVGRDLQAADTLHGQGVGQKSSASGHFKGISPDDSAST